MDVNKVLEVEKDASSVLFLVQETKKLIDNGRKILRGRERGREEDEKGKMLSIEVDKFLF